MTSPWKKTSDKWTSYSGPSYLHVSGKVSIGGGWGVTGDNIRGWKKGRYYTIFGRNEAGKSVRLDSTHGLKFAKKLAEKDLASLPKTP